MQRDLGTLEVTIVARTAHIKVNTEVGNEARRVSNVE